MLNSFSAPNPWRSSALPPRSFPSATGSSSNLIDFGFKGGIYPINPKADEIRGVKAYKSILDVPEDQHRRRAHGHPGQIRPPGRRRLREERASSTSSSTRADFPKSVPKARPSRTTFWNGRKNTASGSSAPTARGSSTPTRPSAPTATSPSPSPTRAISPSWP